MIDPRDGQEAIAFWGFSYDYDDDHGGGFVSGQLLVRADGEAFMRMGGSHGSENATWSYREWQPFPRWKPETDVARALRAFKGRGYDVCEPGPTPLDVSEFGPVPGPVGLAQYL